MAIEYKVKLSRAANNDLEEIFSYISNTFSATQAAQSLMREIHERIMSLGEMPGRFSRSLDVTLAEKGYRRAIVNKYVILFTIDEDKQTVNILRIFHGTTDYARYI